MQSNPGKLITKYQFSTLLNKAWMMTMTPSNICSGFKKCGIYPFNPNAIQCGLVASSTVDNSGVNLMEKRMVMLALVMKVTTSIVAVIFLLTK